MFKSNLNNFNFRSRHKDIEIFDILVDKIIITLNNLSRLNIEFGSCCISYSNVSQIIITDSLLSLTKKVEQELDVSGLKITTTETPGMIKVSW